MANNFKLCPTHFSRGAKKFVGAPHGYGPGCASNSNWKWKRMTGYMVPLYEQVYSLDCGKLDLRINSLLPVFRLNLHLFLSCKHGFSKN